MYPLSFKEFLIAIGRENLIPEIQKHFESNERMDKDIHELCLKLYRTYLIIGGTAGIFGEAIDWLKNGGIVYQVYKVNPINIELLSDEELELNNYYNHITKILFFYNISFYIS